MSDEILTMNEAAAILKMTGKQVYELTRRRSLERMQHPFPAFNIHAKAKRVRRSDLMAWIDTLAKRASVGCPSLIRGFKLHFPQHPV
jgi:hypothetical protein